MSAIVTRSPLPTGLVALENRLPELAGISTYNTDPTRMFKLMRIVYEKQPELSRCTTSSLFQCFADCVRLDLDPGKEAHIIPFKGEATLIVGYSGLVKVIVRSGVVSWVNPTPVFQGEPFRVLSGTVDKIEHERRADVAHDRNALVAVHTKVAFNDPNTDPMIRVMYKDQIEAIRTKSKKGQEHPWIGQFTYVSMALKTGIRDTAKYLNLPAKAKEELEVIDRQEFDIDSAPRTSRVVVGATAADRAARLNGNVVADVEPKAQEPQPEPPSEPEQPEIADCPADFADAGAWRSACIDAMVARGFDRDRAAKVLDWSIVNEVKATSYLSTSVEQRRELWRVIVTGLMDKRREAKAPATKPAQAQQDPVTISESDIPF